MRKHDQAEKHVRNAQLLPAAPPGKRFGDVGAIFRTSPQQCNDAERNPDEKEAGHGQS
jgi:hypothetical protein